MKANRECQKFIIGSIVEVKGTLVENKDYGNESLAFTSKMTPYKHKKLKVVGFSSYGNYICTTNLDSKDGNITWVWCDDMLISINNGKSKKYR